MGKQATLNIIDICNSLNKIAEIGWNELKTTDFIINKLGKNYLKKGVGDKEVGVVYQVGNGKDKIVLRADLDGLEFDDGVFHACGHSSHMTGLISAVEYARKMENELNKRNKSVLFVFQPAEETYPSGAKSIADGWEVFGGARYVLGLHVDPNLEVGEVWCRPGVVMAWGDYFEITVKGRTTHVKDLSKGCDTVIDAIEGACIAVAEIKNFQRTIGGSAVVNVGTIKGGLQPNSIAGKVEMAGDVRARDEEDLVKIRSFLKRELPAAVGKQYKGEIEVRYFDGYRAVINDASLANSVEEYLINNNELKMSTAESVFDFSVEDFSFYDKVAPLLFAKVGTGGGKLHARDFVVPQETLKTIEKYWRLVINWWINIATTKTGNRE